MCGRFTQRAKKADIRTLFDVEYLGPFIAPRYNVAPTQPALVVRLDLQARREVLPMRWGLVPHWAKDIAIGNKMINARSETAHEKPSVKNALRRRRCLVPVNEFYEWEKLAGTKQPYAISMADEALFALAGLWEHWQDDQGNELETFTILTTSANELIGELHDRMPVIIDRENFPAWLDHATEDTDVARELCRPYPSELMMHRPVSRYVNNARHEGPACLEAPA
jgi:putative SOS response-associated peptidase YedK